MSESIYEDDKDVISYNPDLLRFGEILKTLTQKLAADESSWFRLSDTLIQTYFKIALVVYANINLKDYFAIKGKFSNEQILSSAQDVFRVPRFVRDMFREITRPMVDGTEIFVPNLFHTFSHDWKILSEDLSLSITEFHRVVRGLGRHFKDLVSLDREVIPPTIYSIYDKKEDSIFALSPLPDWRDRAFSALRHFVFIREAPEHQEETEIDIPQEYQNPQRFMRGMIVGRFINNRRFYRITAISTRTYLVDDNSRFPTDISHSTTPPHKAKDFISESLKSKPQRYKMKSKNSKKSNNEVVSDGKD